MNKTKPGYNTNETLDVTWPKMVDDILKFMFVNHPASKSVTLLDVGPEGYKSRKLAEHWNVVQLNSEDFNCQPMTGSVSSSKLITCFETIEHIQNPLFFFDDVTKHLEEGGSIYLTTPGRPMIFYPPFHFFEMPPKHLEKWIFEPCGFEIVRHKKLFIGDDKPWWFYFTGIRPFLRLLWFGNTNLYEIKRKK